MSPVVDRLVDPPLLFAQRGAARTERPDSADAHRLAVRLGATGVLSTARRSRDGGSVVVGGGRRPLRRSRELSLVSLQDIVAPAGLSVALVVEDAGVARDVVEMARSRGEVERVWICSSDQALLVDLRAESPAARLLHRCVPAEVEGGAERHAAALRSDGIDGVLVPEDRVVAGLVALMHRFRRLVLAEGADHPRTALRGLRNGVDGIAGADVEALTEALAAASEPGEA